MTSTACTDCTTRTICTTRTTTERAPPRGPFVGEADFLAEARFLVAFPRCDAPYAAKRASKPSSIAVSPSSKLASGVPA